ncbi:uncharacterized protein DUF3168 [Tepidamorphus gemmatus]|uniref:Uncharacterized protein DUF3168 n=1 Tax=Tepidamorphus gemmatus TaxID=747076 RepID=A0A4R3LRA5_9HYPH|nr:DUF3168 domain-containing protein [Tepidamorphus gemmatus]TCT02821.1 uncharacterized protein DUF3168 [Tepidamorphus gemmatus]
MSAALALQAALFAALRGDALLAGLTGGRIHDAPPQNSGFPHLVLADLASVDASDSAHTGAEHVATFLVWSRAGGRRETLEILGAMTACLDGAALPLDGHHLVSLAVERTETRREPDGRTFRGLLRLRAVTEAQ